MAVRTGIEPVISSVTGRHVNRYTNAPDGADEGNRTLVSTLARSRSTIELHLHNGVLEPIRTADRPLRRRMLYPLSYEDKWRRSWDLNPGAGFPTYRFSRPDPSATWVLLQAANLL